jgi:hypothetical protein
MACSMLPSSLPRGQARLMLHCGIHACADHGSKTPSERGLRRGLAIGTQSLLVLYAEEGSVTGRIRVQPDAAGLCGTIYTHSLWTGEWDWCPQRLLSSKGYCAEADGDEACWTLPSYEWDCLAFFAACEGAASHSAAAQPPGESSVGTCRMMHRSVLGASTCRSRRDSPTSAHH